MVTSTVRNGSNTKITKPLLTRVRKTLSLRRPQRTCRVDNENINLAHQLPRLLFVARQYILKAFDSNEGLWNL